MTTYEGPAKTTTGQTEYQVTAQLAITDNGGLKEWHGEITAQDEAAAWAIFNTDNPTLHIDGQGVGDFIPMTFNADTAELRIQGSGLAPFGS